MTTRDGKRSGWDNILAKGETTVRGKWETTARCRSISRTRVNRVRETNGVSSRSLPGCASRGSCKYSIAKNERAEPAARSNWLPSPRERSLLFPSFGQTCGSYATNGFCSCDFPLSRRGASVPGLLGIENGRSDRSIIWIQFEELSI